MWGGGEGEGDSEWESVREMFQNLRLNLPVRIMSNVI